MTDKDGTLHLQPSGRWAILRPGREPFELTSGDVFRVEVGGKLQITRMGHLWGEGYYSVDGYKLRDGMRAAIGVEALPRKPMTDKEGTLRKRWTVMRWSGRDCDAPRVRFVGTPDKARAKYTKLHEVMRQGGVELIDADGKIVERAWAPRLRTRW
jgi:Domain of unknown function (DUF5348)